MITLKVVVNKECRKSTMELLDSDELSDGVDIHWFNVDSTNFTKKRDATKIVNDYAVSEFPFVLVTEGDHEYAAVYSEEAPLTIERINAKL